MRYGPEIRGWCFYFDKTYGLDNRKKVLEEFVKFWRHPDAQKWHITDKTMLGGKIYNDKDTEDGEEIFTAELKIIERAEREDYNGAPRDVVCATTVSDEVYYFYLDDRDYYMIVMLGDFLRDGEPDPRRNIYLKREFRNKNLL